LREKLNKLGFDTADSTSHIIPVIIGDNEKTVALSKKLFDEGFLVVAIRPPTVPPGTARLRISLQSDHTKQQIDALCDALI
jgi:8-amino-7-oxononanoate synthase